MTMELTAGRPPRERPRYRLRRNLEGVAPKLQLVERGFLPNFLFTPHDLIVTLGQDGLVVNTAKYLDGQPVIGGLRVVTQHEAVGQ